jgi:hypothetical protein
MSPNLYLLLTKASMLASNVNSATHDDGNSEKNADQSSGLTQETFNWIGDQVKDSLKDFGSWLIHGLFDILSPFIEWGAKSIIVACIVIYFCTEDKRAISTGMKFFFIYLIFMMIRGVIL